MAPLFDQIAIALEHATLIRELRVARDASEASSRIVQGLYEIAANDQLEIEQQIRASLELVSDLLGSDYGLVSRIINSDYHVEHLVGPEADEKGETHHLEDTYCHAVMDQRDLVAIDKATGTEWEQHTSFLKYHFESYVGSPIWIDGDIHGTISFFSRQPRTLPFAPQELEFVRLVSRWMATMIARSQAEQLLAHRVDHIQALYDIVSKPIDASDQVRAALESGCAILGMDMGLSLIHI